MLYARPARAKLCSCYTARASIGVRAMLCFRQAAGVLVIDFFLYEQRPHEVNALARPNGHEPTNRMMLRRSRRSLRRPFADPASRPHFEDFARSRHPYL